MNPGCPDPDIPRLGWAMCCNEAGGQASRCLTQSNRQKKPEKQENSELLPLGKDTPVGRVKATWGSLMDCYRLPYFHLCSRKTSWKHSEEFLPEKLTLFSPAHLDFGLLTTKGGRLCTKALFALCWLAKGDKIKASWLGRQQSAFGSIAVGFWRRRRSVRVWAGGSGKVRGCPSLPTTPSSRSPSGTSSTSAKTCMSFSCRVEGEVWG